MTEPQPDADDEASRIVQRIQKLAEKGKARAIQEGRAEPPEPPPVAKIIQLPLWPEPVRGAPNASIRSALFAGIHSKDRKTLGHQPKEKGKPLDPVLIAAQTGLTIKYAGLQLNQYDATVFFEALHRARHHPLETECFFHGYDFLKTIGRLDSSREYEDLHDSLTRLRDGRAVINWEEHGRRYHFEGGLIAYYKREETTRLYKITFAKEIKALFAPACWTQIEWAERMALNGYPQAQWFHSYFCSHADPFPVSVSFLHEKSGSAATLLKNYRTALKNTLGALKKIGWRHEWKDDLITVIRPPSASQARHVIRSTAKKDRKDKRRNKGFRQLTDFLPGFTKPDKK
jgi:TrfA protein